MIIRDSFLIDATETVLEDIDSSLNLCFEKWKDRDGFINLEIRIHSVYLTDSLRDFIISILTNKYQFKEDEIADITESDDEKSIIVTLDLRNLL